MIKPGLDNPHESLHTCMVFAPNDWSESKREAWIYGIVVGWGRALDDVAKKHRWAPEDVNRLKIMHQKFAHTRLRNNRRRKEKEGKE